MNGTPIPKNATSSRCAERNRFIRVGPNDVRDDVREQARKEALAKRHCRSRCYVALSAHLIAVTTSLLKNIRIESFGVTFKIACALNNQHNLVSCLIAQEGKKDRKSKRTISSIRDCVTPVNAKFDRQLC
jgi:hypothetical protein